ncbi:MAG: hypothetical protein ACEPOV_14315 [Hyphomicrobiales bacterium]
MKKKVNILLLLFVFLLYGLIVFRGVEFLNRDDNQFFSKSRIKKTEKKSLIQDSFNLWYSQKDPFQLDKMMLERIDMETNKIHQVVEQLESYNDEKVIIWPDLSYIAFFENKGANKKRIIIEYLGKDRVIIIDKMKLLDFNLQFINRDSLIISKGDSCKTYIRKGNKSGLLQRITI